MSEKNKLSDPSSITTEEEAHDQQVGAKMRLFLDRMLSTAQEEEGIDSDRATDILMCAVIQLFVERNETTPEEVSLFCKAIAREVQSGASGGEVLH